MRTGNRLIRDCAMDRIRFTKVAGSRVSDAD